MADNSNNKKKENKNNKQKKSFFKDVKAELKKVTWPTKKQVVNNTVGVIVIVIITAIIVFALDFALQNFNKHVVDGIRTQLTEVQNENTVSDSGAVIENTLTEDTSNVVDDTAANTVSE